jgi:hypothetical protein
MKIDKRKLAEVIIFGIVSLIAYYPIFWLVQNDHLAGGLAAGIGIFLYFIYQDFLRDKIFNKK